MNPAIATKDSCPEPSVDRIPFPFITLFCTFVTIAIWLSPAATTFLQYDGEAIGTGQVWRLFTCQFTHFSFDHLLWDVAAFALLGGLCEIRNHSRFSHCLTISLVAIPLAIWMFRTDVSIYRGLSGIDSALFTFLAVNLIRSNSNNGKGRRGLVGIAWLALLLFVIKIGIETATAKAVFVSDATMTPLPFAHLTGAVLGLACSGRLVWRLGPASMRRVSGMVTGIANCFRHLFHPLAR